MRDGNLSDLVKKIVALATTGTPIGLGGGTVPSLVKLVDVVQVHLLFLLGVLGSNQNSSGHNVRRW